ncbi:MAG TPA: ribonuclease H-like domain-containing protein [Candidatus Saccharimonadales bacterium]|nr:ribonuclease H-like domain-containing protein [Candidatus Saccharimonadales bacterium]
MALVFDIETAGHRFEELPPTAQEFLLRYCTSPEEQELEKRRTGLSPFTAEVVCVALYDTEKAVGLIIARPGTQPVPREESVSWTAAEDEPALLEWFWRVVGRNAGKPVVSFNGRSFDVPFLTVRSGILGVKVSRDLLGHRYSTEVHIDLYDQLRFQNAARWRVNLDLACRTFGIASPKSEEAHGYLVQDMWEQGRGVDIARYCYGDVLATAELYRRWQEFMLP